MDLATLDRMSTGQLVARAELRLARSCRRLLNFLPLLSGNVLADAAVAGSDDLSLAAAGRWSAWSCCPGCSPCPTGCAGGSSRPPGTPSNARATHPDRRRRRHRRPRGQGLRAGGAARSTGSPPRPRPLTDRGCALVRLQSRYQPLLETIPAFAQVAILALGGWLALHHRISLGTFLAFSTYVAQFVAAGPPACRRPDHRRSTPAPASSGSTNCSTWPDDRRRAGRGRAARRCAARSPSTTSTSATTPDAPVLRGFDLHDRGRANGRPGRAAAAAANPPSPRWSRASTTRTPGRVLIDGHDVRERDGCTRCAARSASRSRTASCSPTPSRANIAYGRPERTDAEIEAAARAAAAHEFILELPRRLRHPGRRARPHAVRRATATRRARPGDPGRPAVLVLDDATSAVDARTEEAIHDALRAVLAGRTTLLIAHRRVHAASGRPDRRRRGRPGRRARHPRRAERSAARVYRSSALRSGGRGVPRSATASKRLPRRPATGSPRRRGGPRRPPCGRAAATNRPARPLGAGLGGGGRAAGAHPGRQPRTARPGAPRCGRYATCPHSTSTAESPARSTDFSLLRAAARRSVARC